MFEDILAIEIITFRKKTTTLTEIRTRIESYLNRGYIEDQYKDRPIHVIFDIDETDHIVSLKSEDGEIDPDDYSYRLQYRVKKLSDIQGKLYKMPPLIGDIYLETDDVRNGRYSLAIELGIDVKPTYLEGKFLMDLAHKVDFEFNQLDLKILHELIETDSLLNKEANLLEKPQQGPDKSNLPRSGKDEDPDEKPNDKFMVPSPDITTSRMDEYEWLYKLDILKNIFKDYNPETARTIICAIPEGHEKFIKKGGRWGPQFIAPLAFLGKTTVGRYLSLFKEIGVKRVDGIEIP